MKWKASSTFTSRAGKQGAHCAFLRGTRRLSPEAALFTCFCDRRGSQNIECSLMPIAEILDQIDAYLFSLRQARELLSAPMDEVPHQRTPPQKRKARIQRTAAAAATKPSVQKKKAPSGAPAADRSTAKERPATRPSFPARSSLSPQAPPPDAQPRAEEPKPTPAQTVKPEQIIITEPPSPPKQAKPVKAVRRSTPKPPVRPKPEIAKPAIALAGSMNSRIVVVSAEQARQERDRTAPLAEVRRPRLPSTGLNGKLAFEALFKDSSDPSRSSGH